MDGRFIEAADIVHENVDWGSLDWIARPSTTGADRLVIVDVTIYPGHGHAFHRHPAQAEAIWVREGRIEQWLGSDRRELGPGEGLYVPPGTVHASFTIGDSPARLTVVLTPAAGDDGYVTVDVSDAEPWASLRTRR